MNISRSALATVAAAAIVLGLSACDPSGLPALPDPSDSATKPIKTVAPEESETPEPEPEPEGLTAADYENLLAAIDTGNTAAIEGYLAGSVNFILAATECCGPMTPVEVIAELDYTNSGVDPWVVTPEATVDVYRTGFYVDYFPVGAYVIESSESDPMVVSFQFTGEEITGIFICAGASLLMP